MRISIGILAWNEADTIAGCLRSLLSQSIFLKDPQTIESIEVIVVPNGSTDGTAEAARIEVASFRQLQFKPRVEFAVKEVAVAGKSNAWNEYVHNYSDPMADFLVFLDADIELDGNDVLERLIEGLLADQCAVIAVGMPVKTITRKRSKTLFDHLSLSASAVRGLAIGINGGMYSAHGEVLRRIWMPPGLLVEDGFLKAIIITEQFTLDDKLTPKSERLIRVPEARVFFEGCETIGGLIRHERRLLMGTIQNSVLYTTLWDIGKKCHAGEFIRNQNATDPMWLSKLLAAQAAKKRWLVPKGYITHRATRAKRAGQFLRRAPVVLMAIPLDLLVAFMANRKIKNNHLSW